MRPARWRATLSTLRTGLKRLSRRVPGSGRRDRSNADRVASRWSRLASEAFVHDLDRISWSGIPQVHLNHNYLITGTRETYWIEWMRDRFFTGGHAGDVLSLGCGAGHLDRILKGCGFRFDSFTGIDISDGAVDRARTLADEIGVSSEVVSELYRESLLWASDTFSGKAA